MAIKEVYKMPGDTFQKKRFIEQNENLRAIQSELPPFCISFFRAIADNTSILTRVNYAYDLRLFFKFLCVEEKIFPHDVIKDFPLDELGKITSENIELFLEYLSAYKGADGTVTNSECGKSRKLSTLRSFFKYYFKKGQAASNVASLVQLPKLHEKTITRLEADEAANLLDVVESGASLSPAQARCHRYTKIRDVAILTLFLTTGIRISELVGINVQDIDFSVNGFRITRKGGSQAILYFNAEAEKALKDHLSGRNAPDAVRGSEDALFLSLQHKRMSVRSVQNLVKKYARIIAPLKRISPHKLRSTYGTMLYQETGDIYLVADVLGHKDVNTTKKHYAAISDEKRRMAARAVKIRDD
ncbi:MAG: tyrosine-type recombinase/integrase [Bacillota bacterium]|nr:tyrosine-type recombinase/integrase [Bacillota bacterium]